MGSLNSFPLNSAVLDLQPLLPGAYALAMGAVGVDDAAVIERASMPASQAPKLSQLQKILRAESCAGRFVYSQPLGYDLVGEQPSRTIWRL